MACGAAFGLVACAFTFFTLGVNSFFVLMFVMHLCPPTSKILARNWLILFTEVYLTSVIFVEQYVHDYAIDF